MSIQRREFLKAVAGAGIFGIPFGNPAFGAISQDEITAEWPDNPFLNGNYRPVFEEVDATDLKILGSLPAELQGMFVRNGPNPQFPPKGNYHWFDGDGMLHGVLIRDGKASYRNRWVRTSGFEAEANAGKAIWGGLSEPPDMKLVAQGLPPFKNAANTSVVWHDGKLLALWEGGDPHVISVPELGTIGPIDFDGKLKHAFTAHPKIDPVTGEMFCFGYQPVPPFVSYSVIDVDGTIRSTSGIDVPQPVMMHDFAITERYAIFMDLPATFNWVRMLAGGPFLSFQPERPSRFGVLPRDGDTSQIRWFESPACYVFHTLNAFEEGDEVVLIGCRYERFPGSLGMGGPQAGGALESPNDDAETPRLYEWRFNMVTGETTESTIDDIPAEFPRVNDEMMGRQSRFGYVVGGSMDRFVKFDFLKRRSVAHHHGKGRLGGEGVFVPRPNAAKEDDGWLLTFVYDQSKDASELVIVDTQAFDDEPVARVLIPHRIPFGFHGTWLSSDLLG